jgi:hypothetical protein
VKSEKRAALRRRISDGVRTGWKRLLSYRKQDWGFRDYPIVVRVQRDVPIADRYWARILGWNIDETADSREEAIRKLEVLFESRKALKLESREPVPRPGTRVSIQFASSARVDSHGSLKQDFIQRVLKVEWAFISDETELIHFTGDQDTSEFVERIREVYGVDVSDIESGSVSEILDRIEAERTDS